MSSSSSQYIATPPGAVLTEAKNPILTESLEIMTVDSSSSSSTTGNLFLDNIGLFRQYSLDADLINYYFNRGWAPESVDLSGFLASSSSSSSTGFLLRISISSSISDPFEFGFLLPEDLDFFFYGETSDGSPSPGLFHAEKTAGRNEVLVYFSYSPPSASSFGFQLNVEHESLAKLRLAFSFSDFVAYEYPAETYPKRNNELKRLGPQSINYLLSWISQFWTGWDQNDRSLVPDFVKPAEYEDIEFDPFFHARCKIIEDTQGQLASLAGPNLPALSPGNNGMIEPWNFLGVSPETWKCIAKNPGGLYKATIKKMSQTQLEDWAKGDPSINLGATNFDCRSFTMAAAYFLRDQLARACPKVEPTGDPNDPNKDCKAATVKMQRVGQKGKSHVLILVDLGGCNCCKGTFLYEPQSGKTWDSVDSYCAQNKDHCRDKSFWKTSDVGQESEDETFFNPDWEKYPEERKRIKDVICGCLGGSHPPGSSEAFIKDKCDNGGFQDWFADNFKYEPGRTTSPMTGMPDVMDCKKVLCLDPSVCGKTSKCDCEDPNGVLPYLCQIRCRETWNCNGETYACFPTFTYSSDYDPSSERTESDCLDACSNDKVCVYDWQIKYNCDTGQWESLSGGGAIGQCAAKSRFQSSSEWQSLDDSADACLYRTFRLVGSDPCDGTCPSIPEGDPSTPAGVGNLPPTPTGCCGSWCVYDYASKSLTGACESGTIASWKVADDNNSAQSFQSGKFCSELTCEGCAEGYRQVGSGSPMLRTQEIQCSPDCNHPEHACGPGYCCEENIFLPINERTNSCVPCDGCCEPDPLLGSFCAPCPDKVRSIRFYDQYPEFGKSPWG